MILVRGGAHALHPTARRASRAGDEACLSDPAIRTGLGSAHGSGSSTAVAATPAVLRGREIGLAAVRRVPVAVGPAEGASTIDNAMPSNAHDARRIDAREGRAVVVAGTASAPVGLHVDADPATGHSADDTVELLGRAVETWAEVMTEVEPGLIERCGVHDHPAVR